MSIKLNYNSIQSTIHLVPPCSDSSKIVNLSTETKRNLKRFCVLASPALSFNHRAQRKPKQTLKYYLSHRRFRQHLMQPHSRQDWLSGEKIKPVNGWMEEAVGLDFVRTRPA